MIMNSCNVSRDGKKYYCSIDMNIEEDKDETMYAQRVFNLEHEMTIVSKSTLPVLTKYGKEIVEMVREKYPEDIIANDFSKFIEFLDTIDAD